PNTSRGMSDVALCFPWRRGDRVILFEGEFPANVTPWQRAAETFGLSIAWVPLSAFHDGAASGPKPRAGMARAIASSEEAGLDRLRAELARGARLVAVSAVQFQTGLRMPVESMAALCHASGAEIFIDAVQCCGAVPIDAGASGVDYLASGSHKWLMGLEGAG